MERKSAQKRGRSCQTAWTTPVQIYSMNSQKLEEVWFVHVWPSDQLQVTGSNPVEGWHLLSRNPHQDCLSNGSNVQTKQDLVVQHHHFLTHTYQCRPTHTHMFAHTHTHTLKKHFSYFCFWLTWKIWVRGHAACWLVSLLGMAAKLM